MIVFTPVQIVEGSLPILQGSSLKMLLSRHIFRPRFDQMAQEQKLPVL